MPALANGAATGNFQLVSSTATAIAGATMLLVAAPWIAVLSDTYDRFTTAEVGSTRPYHFWLVVGYAEFSPHRLGQPYRLDWEAKRASLEQQFKIPPTATVLRVQPYAGLSVIEYEVK